jgi:uncharacterized glyoxalase superfamily protein PhnB
MAREGGGVVSAPRLTGSAAILLVRDVVAAAEHYRDRLGFSFDRFWGEPPNFVILSRDGCRLMLHQPPSRAAIVPHWRVSKGMWNVYFWVDDAEALFADFKRRGATIDYDIHDKPYGIREFGIRDLDGHDIAFGSPIREAEGT